MSTEYFSLKRTVQAASTITADCLFKALTIGGTVAASALQAVGIARSQAVAGQGVTTIVNGSCKVRVGAAVNTIGYGLTVTTSGWLIANATSGSATIGRALQVANSGDTILAYVDFTAMAAFAPA